MGARNLYTEAELLEKELIGACHDTRLSIQPDLSALLHKMRLQGVQIPPRLRRLDAALCEDVTEARFDNVPV